MTLLSIYIPTWNRPHLLKNLLDSIEPQLTNEVDVYVSINKSEKDYVLPKWAAYRKTRINIGGDANIICGPTLVSGKYVWVIGDDETLLPGAIEATLKTIALNPGLIIHPDGKYDLGAKYGQTFSDYAEFCKHLISVRRQTTITAHTLISSNTFLRDAYDPVLALQTIDTRYGFQYGMLTNLFNQTVAIAPQPTMIYGKEPSIFLHDQDVIDEHMAGYPQIMYDLFDWITARTGYPIPYDSWGRGFY